MMNEKFVRDFPSNKRLESNLRKRFPLTLTQSLEKLQVVGSRLFEVALGRRHFVLVHNWFHLVRLRLRLLWLPLMQMMANVMMVMQMVLTIGPVHSHSRCRWQANIGRLAAGQFVVMLLLWLLFDVTITRTTHTKITVTTPTGHFMAPA
jgi:hypothetical protein